MTQKEISRLFSHIYSIDNQVLLVPPQDFYKLKNINIEKSRMFLLLLQGKMELQINGKSYEIETNTFIDLMDTATLQIKSLSPDVQAWCLFSTFEFASDSLKTLRPEPMIHPQKRLNIPIMDFTPQETALVERQLQLLSETLADITHYYRKEMAELYFKSFNLEFGNALFNHLKQTDETPKYINRRDFITLNFFKLVSQHSAEQHRIEFYADTLCISGKHLTRIIKETTGKTPYSFICDEIMHKAMELLENDKISVGQIAEELHFSDQASFCKFFKKQKNISPINYRKRQK